ALGDRPKTPRFIETLSRRGYRFIAPVHEGPATAPALPRSPASDPLVGRAGALETLHACLHRALQGQRQLVFVTGEPGIGKTALVDAFEQQALAAEPGLRVARGQCLEGYGGMAAYYPLLEALGAGAGGGGRAGTRAPGPPRAPLVGAVPAPDAPGTPPHLAARTPGCRARAHAARAGGTAGDAHGGPAAPADPGGSPVGGPRHGGWARGPGAAPSARPPGAGGHLPADGPGLLGTSVADAHAGPAGASVVSRTRRRAAQ